MRTNMFRMTENDILEIIMQVAFLFLCGKEWPFVF